MTIDSSFFDIQEKDYLYESHEPEITSQQSGYFPTRDSLEEGVRNRPLQERVKKIQEDAMHATYVIDQCIQVKTPSDRFKALAIEHWSKEKSEHQTECLSSLAFSTLSGIAAFFTTPFLGIAIVPALLYSGYKLVQTFSDNTQIAEWAVSKTDAIANRRTEAYNKGFLYVYRNNLKLGNHSKQPTLLPFEVEHLFERYLDNRPQELNIQNCDSDKQKKNWLDRFRSENPVSKEILRYAYGKIPEKYVSVNRNFEALASSLDNIEREFNTIRSEKRAKTNDLIESIRAQKALAQLPFSLWLEHKLSEYKKERDSKLKELEKTQQKLINEHLDLQEKEGCNRAQLSAVLDASTRLVNTEKKIIEKVYDDNVLSAQAMYALATTPINYYFNSKITEAENALTQVLQSIKKEEESAFSKYYEYARQINFATGSLQKQNFSYTQEPFTFSRTLHIPELPKIEINFVYQLPPGVDPSILNFKR